MKRRIVRITAGALIVLAWLAAGVYAFWGGKDDDNTEPAVDAAAMSRQIAAANAKPADGSPVQQAVAVEESAVPPLEKKKPAADGLFKPGRLTQPAAKPESVYKPRATTFQPSATPPDEQPDSVYGQDVPDEGYSPPPADDPPMEEAAEASPVPTNPLRKPPASYAIGDDTTAEEPAAPVETPRTFPRPPSRFQPEAGVVEDETDPMPTPADRGIGGRRLSPPPATPLNELPAEDVRGGIGADEGYNAPPLARRSAPLAEQAPGVIASARPGQASFEGTQSPSLVIEKLAPAEIQVGKPARFEIHVKNAGQTTAQNVVVTDHVPAGTQLVDAKPQPEQSADGALLWSLGKLEPGESKSIALELMPRQEGEIGSVAQVTFAAAASVKTVCTKPLLVVEHTAPAKVMIGETVTLSITITNPGTGAASGVVVQEDVPEGLSHSAGNELEQEIGTLRPGETKKLELQLVAAKAGLVQNKLVVRGDANLTASHTVEIEVVAPQLAVAMNGPKRRYLDRQATYTVNIANPGTAAARDVEIVAYLPKGMKFVSTDREGQYDPQNHAVYWSLEELPAAQEGSAQLVTIPIEPGEQKLRVEGRAQQNLNSSDEQLILVEAIPQLVFEIIDEADPIEVGADTVYQVRVTNEGTKAATNVQVAAALPAELRPASADGATRGEVAGQNVVFEPLGKLAPGAEAIFKIQATGLRTGDYTIRVQITSDDLQTPVTKEEPTRVYADG